MIIGEVQPNLYEKFDLDGPDQGDMKIFGSATYRRELCLLFLNVSEYYKVLSQYLRQLFVRSEFLYTYSYMKQF